jgi:CheY-like chemotaxis protein
MGLGSNFTFYLPATAKLPQDAKLPDPNFILPVDYGNKRVLVVEDEADLLALLLRVFKRLGLQVDGVLEGSQAIELYRENLQKGHPYDLVILDLTIPGGLGGKETIAELLTLDPNTKALVASGYSNDPVLANYRDYGFLSTLTKPYRLEELHQKVAEVLKFSYD